MQQLSITCESWTLAVVTTTLCAKPCTEFRAHVQFHAEKPVRPFSGAVISGSLRRVEFLVEPVPDNGGIDNRARAQRQSLLLQMLLDFGKQLFRQPVPLQQMTEVQDRRSSGTSS